MFAFERANLNGRCDLYSVTSCKYNRNGQMDYYVVSSECPAPLEYPELVNKDMFCTATPISEKVVNNFVECNEICKLNAECTWFNYKSSDKKCVIFKGTDCDSTSSQSEGGSYSGWESYRPTGYVPDGCDCQYNPSY